jgi:hypothetical protein
MATATKQGRTRTPRPAGEVSESSLELLYDRAGLARFGSGEGEKPQPRAA